MALTGVNDVADIDARVIEGGMAKKTAKKKSNKAKAKAAR